MFNIQCMSYTASQGDDFPPPPDAGAYKQQYGMMLAWTMNHLKTCHPLNKLMFA